MPKASVLNTIIGTRLMATQKLLGFLGGKTDPVQYPSALMSTKPRVIVKITT